MRYRDLLTESFDRVADELPALLDGLTPEQLLWQPTPTANHIAWLAWHIGRCEDAQIAALTPDAGPDVWNAGGWREQFDLPYPADAIGYGHSPGDVAAFDVTDTALLTGYYAATHEATAQALATLEEADLGRVVDDNWDPPVTLGSRVVSVVNDITQHLGQIAYVRGVVLERS